MKLERKELIFKAEDIDLEEGTFTGHASTFGNVDEHGDVIEKGAFKKTLKEFGSNVKILLQHFNLIGKPLDMKEDDVGLFVRGKISETSLGKDALVLMRDGVLDGLSIGFNTIKSVFDKEKNIRYIKEVKLWEFSLVTWGANTQARVEAVKNQGLLPQIITALQTDEMRQYIKTLALEIEPPLKHNNNPKVNTEELQSLLEETRKLKKSFI